MYMCHVRNGGMEKWTDKRMDGWMEEWIDEDGGCGEGNYDQGLTAAYLRLYTYIHIDVRTKIH